MGRVGRVLVPKLEERGLTVQSRDLSNADIAIDFTTPDAVVSNVSECIDAGVPVIVGTTGWDPTDVSERAKARGVPVFVAPNFAIGAVLMMRLSALASALLPQAHIVEMHDVGKRDMPSGTALATAKRMGTRPGISSIRLPGLIAHQEVIFSSPGEILTIRHDSLSRESFVAGVLLAVERVQSLPAGVTIGLDALIA